MGLFDGLDGSSDTGSTAQMAKWLSAPVILVLDCWAMGRSVAALIKGFEVLASLSSLETFECPTRGTVLKASLIRVCRGPLFRTIQLFDPDLNLAGIILNKVGSPAHAEWLIASLKAANCKVPVIGSIPQWPAQAHLIQRVKLQTCVADLPHAVVSVHMPTKLLAQNPSHSSRGMVPQNLGVAVPEDHHLGMTVPGPDDEQDEYIRRLAEARSTNTLPCMVLCT
eukprot:2707146-Pyramimonas_sp.AAC.1